MKKFSNAWKSSKNPKKQRKYVANAPLHIKQKLVGTHLSPELRKKYQTRSIGIRKEDKVRVMKGQFKKKEGSVEKVLLKKCIVQITGIEVLKKDGSKSMYPFKPCNLMIIEIDTSDKKRMKKLQSKPKIEEKSKNNTNIKNTVDEMSNIKENK